MTNKKIILNFITLALIGAGVFFSCNPESVSPTNNSTGSISLNIDGTNYNSVSITASLFTFESDSTLEIIATLNDGSELELDIGKPNEGVTYSYTDLGANDVNMIYKKVSSGITLSESTSSGSLEITSYDLNTRKVSGSFSFNTDQSNITNGEIVDVEF